MDRLKKILYSLVVIIGLIVYASWQKIQDLTSSVAGTGTNNTNTLGSSTSNGSNSLAQNSSSTQNTVAAQTSTAQTSTSASTTKNTTNTAPASKAVTKSTTPATTGQYKNGTYTGSTEDAFYGNVQVQVAISGGKLTNVTFLQYPSDRRNSVVINNRAIPILQSEAIQAQSANVNGVSGASETSRAFILSLSNALAQAKS